VDHLRNITTGKRNTTHGQTHFSDFIILLQSIVQTVRSTYYARNSDGGLCKITKTALVKNILIKRPRRIACIYWQNNCHFNSSNKVALKVLRIFWLSCFGLLFYKNRCRRSRHRSVISTIGWLIGAMGFFPASVSGLRYNQAVAWSYRVFYAPTHFVVINKSPRCARNAITRIVINHFFCRSAGLWLS